MVKYDILEIYDANAFKRLRHQCLMVLSFNNLMTCVQFNSVSSQSQFTIHIIIFIKK